MSATTLKNELQSVKQLVADGRADGYILVTNSNVTEGDRKKISAALKECGVTRPYVFGKDWVVAKILEHPKVRALVPRVYGLGEVSWITDHTFFEDSRVEALLTSEQLEELGNLARNDLLDELDDIIDGEADGYDSEWDIEGWFDELRSCLRALENLFPEDTDVSIAVEMAEDHIKSRVRQLEEDYADTWRPDEEHHASGQAVVSVGSRSIFDDLVD